MRKLTLFLLAVAIGCVGDDSNNTSKRTDVLTSCAAHDAAGCPDHCVVYDVTDLSHDLNTSEPTCKGATTSVCADDGTGSAIRAVYYRDEGEPSAILSGEAYYFAGWTACPTLQEGLTGDEPAVCQCAYQ